MRAGLGTGYLVLPLPHLGLLAGRHGSDVFIFLHRRMIIYLRFPIRHLYDYPPNLTATHLHLNHVFAIR